MFDYSKELILIAKRKMKCKFCIALFYEGKVYWLPNFTTELFGVTV
jgi:hypothetical protein